MVTPASRAACRRPRCARCAPIGPSHSADREIGEIAEYGRSSRRAPPPPPLPPPPLLSASTDHLLEVRSPRSPGRRAARGHRARDRRAFGRGHHVESARRGPSTCARLSPPNSALVDELPPSAPTMRPAMRADRPESSAADRGARQRRSECRHQSVTPGNRNDDRPARRRHHGAIGDLGDGRAVWACTMRATRSLTMRGVLGRTAARASETAARRRAECVGVDLRSDAARAASPDVSSPRRLRPVAAYRPARSPARRR